MDFYAVDQYVVASILIHFIQLSISKIAHWNDVLDMLSVRMDRFLLAGVIRS